MRRRSCVLTGPLVGAGVGAVVLGAGFDGWAFLELLACGFVAVFEFGAASAVVAFLAAPAVSLLPCFVTPSGLPLVAGSLGALSLGVTSLKSEADSLRSFGTG